MRAITPDLIREVQAKATLLYSKQDICRAIDEMAENMQEKLHDKNCVFLTVMNGGLFIASELCQRLNFPLQMDYVHATRYHGEVTGSNIHWKQEPSLSLSDRTVVIIDDILDGGITLRAITDYCYRKGAKETYTAVLLDKVNARLPEGLAKADFTGIVEKDNAYVYGFGLDYHDYLRNVCEIYKVAPEHMF